MARPITSATAVCGIVLHPAGHTRSPAMHNAAFAALGIDATYHAFDVKPADLGPAIHGVRALGVRQVAVSIPHKQKVLEFVDEIDPVARRIGAANTVTRVAGRLVATNTDWIGAVRALERETSLSGRHAVVLGAGGAARAVVYGLLEAGCRVSVLNRSPERAHALARDLGATHSGALTDLGSLAHDILVNTTSVGLRSDVSPVAADALRAGSLVMDSVYDPEQTRLLRDAAARAARPLSGKWMLVYQAAEQLRLWSGREAPVEVMAAAFDAAGATGLA